eukprot:TRINITY_DN5595_c0_g1_i4.p1 TRINITY_DN5595_c0_g1~~TRINITY_DN5595_c0_g1_i4.p1  ORF type:complete len:428 (+),score=70.87 TRINITY_DN5595_c0_g1_i4:147-1286(+)
MRKAKSWNSMEEVISGLDREKKKTRRPERKTEAELFYEISQEHEDYEEAFDSITDDFLIADDDKEEDEDYAQGRESSHSEITSAPQSQLYDILYEQEEAKLVILGGTEARLMGSLVDVTQDLDMTYVKEFLMTHHYFTSSETVFNYLVQSFVKEEPDLSLRQSRIIIIFEKWIENHYSDFKNNRSLEKNLSKFLKKTLLNYNSERASSKLRRLRRQSRENLGKRRAQEMEVNSKPLQDPSSRPPEDLLPPTSSILQFQPLEISKLLCVLEHNKYCSIPISEFYHQSWNGSDSAKLSPGLLKCINHFNIISRWIITETVNHLNLTQRVSVVKMFLNIAETCIELNNYNSAMEIYSGLNSSYVSRLKKTWKVFFCDSRVLD